MIALESLNVKRMVKNHNLAKLLSDASCKTIGIQGKLNEKPIIKTGRWYLSCETCYECGQPNQDLTASER